MGNSSHPFRHLDPDDRRAVIVKEFCDCGFDVSATARAIGVSKFTLYRWVREDEELRMAMKTAVRVSIMSAHGMDGMQTMPPNENVSGQEQVEQTPPVAPRRVVEPPIRYEGVAPRGAGRSREGNWE